MAIYYDDAKETLDNFNDSPIHYCFMNVALIQTTTLGQKNEAANIRNNGNDHWSIV
jgi:hypothetical protein